MRRRFPVALALILAAAALSGQQPANPAPSQRPDGQQPSATFRSEVLFVEVDAIVRDAKGNFVRDLKPEDFQVLDGGVPQKVTAFSLVDVPVVQADRPLFVPREQEIEPDVRSNEEGPAGRIYVLLLDDVHTAFQRTPRVKQLAKQFIERSVGANDLVAVLHTSGFVPAQDFTNNRRLLNEAVDKFMGRKLRSAYLSKLEIYTRNRASGDNNTIADPDDAERLQQARNLLETVKNISNWLAGVHGRRKALILVGEGLDYGIAGADSYYESSGSSSSSSGSSGSGDTPADTNSRMPVGGNRGDGLTLIPDSQQAIAAATRANVNIYGIDPRGLAVADEDMIMVSGAPPDDPSLGLRSTELADELRRGQDSLRVLSEQTGGFASVASNDFAPAFQRIVEENSTYYMLGYNPTDERRDGRFRRVQVRVNRQGVEVKARKGYTAPSGKPAKENTVGASAGTSKELREELDNPIQSSDFKFSVFAAPLKGPEKKAVVAVVSQFDWRDIGFGQSGAQRTNTLEISYVAIDGQGKVAAGSREKVDLALKPETYQRVVQNGFRVQARLEVPPGRYQLRVAAREAGGRIGSVHYDLVVPDFGDRTFSMSGLVLTSKAAGAVPTAGAIAELAEALPAAPTTARTFHVGDELTVFAEIYDNYTRQSHSLDITTTLKAEGNVAVYSNTETRSSKELGGGKGGFGHAARIPLANLAPGLYVLRVEAKPTVKGTTGIAREVQIRIVP